MFVGDDVVDLAQVSRPSHVAARFEQRVLSSAERMRLEAAPDRGRMLWRLWTAKEAAFKAACKHASGLRFDHARFEVECDGAHGRVRHPDIELAVRWAEGPDWVHAVAFRVEPCRWDAAVAPLAILLSELGTLTEEELSTAPHADSRAARVLAHRLLGGLGAPEGLLVTRTGGPPEVRRARRPTRDAASLGVAKEVAWDVSLSHDGRFVSAVAAGLDGSEGR